MPASTPYLLFNGNCHEAMKFYNEHLNLELDVKLFGDAQMGDPEDAGRVLHARINSNGHAILMASDGRKTHPVSNGTNFAISIAADSREEVDRLYAGLLQGDGGPDGMKPQDMFWGDYFAMGDDKYGVHWMFAFGPNSK